MSSPSEAQTAAEELNSNYISINGCRLTGSVSQENTRLTDGWDVKGDEDEERSEQSDRRTSEPEEKPSEEVHEKDASETEVQEGEETPETSQETPSDKTGENKTEGKETRETPANKTVPEDKNPPEDQDLQQQRDAEKLSDSHEPEVRDPEGSDHPETAEQNAVAAPPFAPAGGATEAERLSKAIGAEFVRPVVGYYCNLCQLIFSDEDEAKGDHCRTPAHYAKYQEKTGKDPWTS